MTVSRLDPAEHGWIRSAPARAVLAALEAARPGCARFVGGCVRNALMGEPVGDLDIATQLTPPETVAALEAAGLKAVPTGVEHGTITAVADGVPIEVTTLRRDVSTDGRRAVVAFTTDWTEDSARRDFRCNAIYCGPDGTLFDPQSGIADALARRIVFIGDAGARIAEDYLRILRFFRFHAQFGRGAPDREGMLACVRGKDGIAALSGERIWSEMKKLLSAPAPEASLRWMQTANVLGAAIGPCNGLEEAAQLAKLSRERGWAPDPLLMLAALTAVSEKDGATRAETLAERLKMSRAERARLLRAARITLRESPRDSLFGAKITPPEPAQLYFDGADAIADALRLSWSRARAHGAREGAATDAQDVAFARALDTTLSWIRPEFPLSGKDLKDAGCREGKSLGDVLRALEQRWIESKFTLDKAQLMALAHDLAGRAN